MRISLARALLVNASLCSQASFAQFLRIALEIPKSHLSDGFVCALFDHLGEREVGLDSQSIDDLGLRLLIVLPHRNEFVSTVQFFDAFRLSDGHPLDGMGLLVFVSHDIQRRDAKDPHNPLDLLPKACTVAL